MASVDTAGISVPPFFALGYTPATINAEALNSAFSGVYSQPMMSVGYSLRL